MTVSRQYCVVVTGSVRGRVTFKSAVIAWKCVNGVAPTYLRELHVPVEDVRGRPLLRSASTRCILLPRIQTATGQRSFAYSGQSAVFNSLPPALRESMSLATFKTKLNRYLFRRSQITMPLEDHLALLRRFCDFGAAI